jgi:hypothetical protein
LKLLWILTRFHFLSKCQSIGNQMTHALLICQDYWPKELKESQKEHLSNALGRNR